MKALFHMAAEVQEMLEGQGWSFCFIGGIALQRWGEPRLTRDIDISLLTGFGNEEIYVDALCRIYGSRIENARDFALRNRVLLLKSDRGIPIDIALAGLPFEETVMARASYFPFLESVSLRTCSAEDLIVYKAFADRSRDWADIEGILLRQRDGLAWEYMEKNLVPLCELKESPHILSALRDLREKMGS